MIMEDVQPGRVVEFDGELYLIEQVKVQMTLQSIESHREKIEQLMGCGQMDPTNPVFMRLEGEIDHDVYSPERFKPLYREDEL